jgi:hypothetical protein
MQNRYIGDVGDFGKYALLRALGDERLKRAIKIAVVWCLYPDESHNDDGRHISYLESTDFVELDIQLVQLLRNAIKSGRRNISVISTGRALPTGTVFYDVTLCPANVRHLSRADRIGHRTMWLEGCLRATRDSDLVFFDPDNGLEVTSVPKHHLRSGKYMYWDELLPFWKRKQSLLIYHHLNRTKSAPDQVCEMMTAIRMKFANAIVRSLVFRRGSCRVFWLIRHRSALGRKIERRIDIFLKNGWEAHFRPF